MNCEDKQYFLAFKELECRNKGKYVASIIIFLVWNPSNTSKLNDCKIRACANDFLEALSAA